MDLGVVKKLFIYPVKGLRGISLESSMVEAEGLAFDRRWMVVGEEGRFRSQRQMPSMATLTTSMDGGLQISDSSGSSIWVGEPETAFEPVTVWQSDVMAYPARNAVNRWLSERLEEPVRLVAMGTESRRRVNPEHGLPGDMVSFADGYPILMASEASLADLNERLSVPVPMDRFRPNVVVSGVAPWAEDAIGDYWVGTVKLQGVKPCARCQVPTIDQTSGEKLGPEPLTTLASFRTWDGKVMFGLNMIPRSVGTISVGEEVRFVSA